MIVLPFGKAVTADSLAASTLVSGAIGQTVLDDMYLISGDFTVTYRGGGAPLGPVTVGIAHSDYTDAEIEEWLELSDSWDTSNLVEQERRRRKIRRIGEFAGLSTMEVLGDGKQIRVPLRFVIQEGMTLKCWVYNKGTGALNADFDVMFGGQIYAKKA